jgi:hypothetical protein
MGFAEEVDELISALAAWFIPEPTPRFVKFRSLASAALALERATFVLAARGPG